MRERFPKIYSRELVDILFSHPIISPVKLGQLLGVHYTTASRHLKAIAEAGYLESWKRGKYHFYVNRPLPGVLGEDVG